MRRGIVAFLVAGTVAIASASWWSFSLVKKEIETSVAGSLQTTLEITQQALKSWIEENTHTVNTTANSPQVIHLAEQLLKTPRTPQHLLASSSQERVRNLLRPVLASHELRGFFLIAPDNISLASTRDSNTGTVNLLAKQPRLLQELWNGKSIVSRPQQSDVPLEDASGVLTPKYPTMFMGAPVKNARNQVIALLTMRIDPKLDFTKVLQRGRIGASGETYAFNKDGVLISNSRFDEQLKKAEILGPTENSILNVRLLVPTKISLQKSSTGKAERSKLPTRMAASALTGKSGISLQSYLDYRGVNVVGAWAWDPEMGMGLATEQDADEAFRALRSTGYILAIFTSFILSGFFAIVLFSESQRKKLVKEIEGRKASEKSLQKLSIAVDQSPASVVITDLEGSIEYVNPMFSKVTEYSSSEAIGNNPRILQSGKIPPETYEDMWAQLTAGRPWSGELINKKKGGEEYTEFATIAPIVNEYGVTTNYVAVTEDITERKATEEALRRSQKMDAIGELTGGLAHDFNNLLGIIVGNLDLVTRKLEPGSRQQEQLESAQNAALRGAEITRRLLNFSRQSPQAHSPIDVNGILAGVEKLVSKSLTSAFSIELSLSDDLWMTEIDPGDLEDAIINLSLNARDAMQSGGRVIIETRNTILDKSTAGLKTEIEPGDFVEIAVSDTGSGMSKEVSDKVFEPFFSTKEKGKGTGLGLSMVHGFVQRINGHISVYSEEGIGTTFRIYLPRAQAGSERSKQKVEDTRSAPVGTETILIVDDEKELATIADSILSDLGYTTRCANSGDEALEILENNDGIDLVFSDVVMPGFMGGFDLAEATSIRYPGIKVLLTSGFTGKMKISEASKKWEEKLLVKPYRDIELALRVRQTLDEKG